MPLKNSGGSSKSPGGHKVIHRTAQTAFVKVVTPRNIDPTSSGNHAEKCFSHITTCALNKLMLQVAATCCADKTRVIPLICNKISI